MAATTAVRRHLSASTNGSPVKVTATATAGTTIHAAGATSDGTVVDEVHLWAVNTSTSDVKLTLELAGATSPDNLIEVTIPAEAGLVPILPGLILDNSKTVAAFAASANVINIVGYVNRISQDAA